MPSHLLKNLPGLSQNLLLALVAGVAYSLAFQMNLLLGPAVLYDDWIALVFLPAGIKHLFILIARGWGALGCFVALLLPSLQFWSDTPVLQTVLYSGISTLASWLGIAIGMRLLDIHRNLDNLRFMHLPMLDLLTTALHGFAVNAYFIAVGMKTDKLLENALAMMVGDFTGSFMVLACLWAVLWWIRQQGKAKSLHKL